MAKKIAAFFDLDHTLLGINSGIEWGILMIKKRLVPLSFILTAGILGGPYKLGLYPFSKVCVKMFKTLKGRDAKKILEVTNKYFEDKKFVQYRSKLLQELGKHKANKHKIIIITQTFNFIGKIFAKDLDAEVHSTRVDIKNNKFTGKVKPCIANEKDNLMIKLAKQQNIDLKKSYAYTDSIRDREMLEVVGHPNVINPNFRFKRLAKQKGWKIWKI